MEATETDISQSRWHKYRPKLILSMPPWLFAWLLVKDTSGVKEDFIKNYDYWSVAILGTALVILAMSFLRSDGMNADLKRMIPSTLWRRVAQGVVYSVVFLFGLAPFLFKKDVAAAPEAEVSGGSVVIEQGPSGDGNPTIVGDGNKVDIKIDTENAVPTPEGIRVSHRVVPSQTDEYSFQLEITVQVQTEINSFGIGFVFDKQYGFAGQRMTGVSTSGFSEGTLEEAPDRSYFVKYDFPSITPQRPIVVNVFANEPISLEKTVRIN